MYKRTYLRRIVKMQETATDYRQCLARIMHGLITAGEKHALGSHFWGGGGVVILLMMGRYYICM